MSFPGSIMNRSSLLNSLLISFFLLITLTNFAVVNKENAGHIDNAAIKKIDSLLIAADNIDQGPELMMSLSEEAFALSKIAGYKYGLLHSTYNIARSLFYQSKLQESYQTLDNLLLEIESDSAEVSKIVNYSVTRSKIYSLMAMIFQDLNDYKTSMKFYFKALSLIEKTGLDYDIGLIYKGLGGLNLSSGNYDKADEYFNKAIELGTKSGDEKIKFDILHEQYDYAKNNGDYTRALEVGIKLYGIAKTSETIYMTAISLKNLGEIYFLLNEYKLAETYLRNVTDTAKYQQFSNVLSECYTILSRLKFRLKEYSSAEKYAWKALEMAEKTSLQTLKADALFELANSLEATGNYKEASKSLRMHVAIKDFLNRISNSNEVHRLQSKFDLDKVINEKNQIEDQLTIKMLESSRKNFLLIASLLLIVLLGWLTVTLIKKYRFEKNVNVTLEQQQGLIRAQELIIQKEKEAQLQMELEHKNRELITRAVALTKIQEEKILLTNNLQDIYLKLCDSDTETSALIDKQIRYLKNNIDTDPWEDFRVYFENVYTEFYDNLSKSHPDLSQNERKLCALLKLNLNTKEIAAINSREVRSIESARNRLRKKLGLSPETNLTMYLSKF